MQQVALPWTDPYLQPHSRPRSAQPAEFSLGTDPFIMVYSPGHRDQEGYQVACSLPLSSLSFSR